MSKSEFSRRAFAATLAAASVFTLVPTLSQAKTQKVDKAAKFKIEDGVVYQITPNQEVWPDIMIDFGEKQMSFAEYAEELERIGGLFKQDRRTPIALSRDPSLFETANADMVDRIRGLGEGQTVTNVRETCIYACLIFVYSCDCRTSE